MASGREGGGQEFTKKPQEEKEGRGKEWGRPSIERKWGKRQGETFDGGMQENCEYRRKDGGGGA